MVELGSGESSIDTLNKGYIINNRFNNFKKWADQQWDPRLINKYENAIVDPNLPISVVDAMNARGGAVPAYFRVYEDIADRGGHNVSEGLTPINASRRTSTMLSYGLRDPNRLKHIVMSPDQGIDPVYFQSMTPEGKIGMLASRELENVRKHAPAELMMGVASPQDIPLFAKYVRGSVKPQSFTDPRSAIGESTLRRGVLLDALSRGEQAPANTLEKSFYAKGGLAQACDCMHK